MYGQATRGYKMVRPTSIDDLIMQAKTLFKVADIVEIWDAESNVITNVKTITDNETIFAATKAHVVELELKLQNESSSNK